MYATSIERKMWKLNSNERFEWNFRAAKRIRRRIFRWWNSSASWHWNLICSIDVIWMRRRLRYNRNRIYSIFFSFFRPYFLIWNMLQEETNDEKLPMTGRLTPIGGASSDTEFGQRLTDWFLISFSIQFWCFFFFFSHNEAANDNDALLEEHERLSASLAALTRHFAHVQLRLHQVVSAPTIEDREVNTKKLVLFLC